MQSQLRASGPMPMPIFTIIRDAGGLQPLISGIKSKIIIMALGSAIDLVGLKKGVQLLKCMQNCGIAKGGLTERLLSSPLMKATTALLRFLRRGTKELINETGSRLPPEADLCQRHSPTGNN